MRPAALFCALTLVLASSPAHAVVRVGRVPVRGGVLPASAGAAGTGRLGAAGTRLTPAPGTVSLKLGAIAPRVAGPDAVAAQVLPSAQAVALPGAAALSVAPAESAPRAAAVANAAAAQAGREPAEARLSGRRARAFGTKLRGLRGGLTRLGWLGHADAPSADGAEFASGAVPEAELAARVLDRTFAENPRLRERFEAELERAYFKPMLGSAREPLAEALLPFFAAVARGSGSGLRESLGGWLAEDGAEGRRGLARMLEGSLGVRSESWTYLFRDSELWEGELRRYLGERIAEKAARGERSLSLQSVGAAYGAEPYSLAILVDEALRAAGEEPDAWQVRIEAYDKSVMSLLSTRAGAYLSPEGGGWRIPEAAPARAQAEFEKGALEATLTPRLYRAAERLRRWIVPVYADLNVSAQHEIVTRARPDVVFANYILIHLLRAPAGKLAEHWLAGGWSEHGFLSMAQTLVAEVFSEAVSPMRGVPLGFETSFLTRFSQTVGWIGASMTGEWGTVWARLRDRLFAHRTRAAKEAFAAQEGFLRALRRDPFHSATLDEGLLATLESLVAETGVPAELTAGDALVGWGGKPGELFVNIGLLLPGGPGRAELLSRLYRALAAKQPKTAVAPAGVAPRFSGATEQGAILKAVREGAATRLYWLDAARLKPITDKYKDEENRQALQKATSGGGIRVTF